jgi:hypothetical protein
MQFCLTVTFHTPGDDNTGSVWNNFIPYDHQEPAMHYDMPYHNHENYDAMITLGLRDSAAFQVVVFNVINLTNIWC